MPKKALVRWKKIREKILKRDEYTCSVCKKTKVSRELHVHHKDGSGVPDANYLSNNKRTNLITICNKCHYKVHWEEARSKGYKNVIMLEKFEKGEYLKDIWLPSEIRNDYWTERTYEPRKQ